MIIKYSNAFGQTRYLVEFSIDGIRYRKKGFEKKSDAKHWEDHERVRVRSGGIKVDRQTTLGDYLDWWHESFMVTDPGDGKIYKRKSGRKYRNANRVRNKQHIEKIKSIIGDVKLVRLNGDHGHKIEQVLRKTTDNPSGIASSSIRGMQFMLKGALSDGVKEKKLDSNPLQNIVVADKAEDHNEPHSFSMVDAQKVLECVVALEDRRWSVFFILALKTGMRKGELAALTWGDVHLDADVSYLDVCRSVDWSEGENKPRIKSTKTKNSKRKIALSPDTAQELKLYRAWQTQKWLEVGKEFDNNTILFFGDNFDLVSKSVPQHRWKQVVKKSGVLKLSLHKLRHTFATFTLEHTGDIRLVSKLLGHSNVRTTEIYIDEKDDVKLEAKMLSAMEGKYSGGDRGGVLLKKS